VDAAAAAPIAIGTACFVLWFCLPVPVQASLAFVSRSLLST
jgi:hypothetical protein